jgi:hypothetical protein
MSWLSQEYEETARETEAETQSQHGKEPANAVGFSNRDRLIRFGGNGWSVRSRRRRFWRKCFRGFCGENSFQRRRRLSQVGLQVLEKSIEASERDFIQITDRLHKTGDLGHRRFALLIRIDFGRHGKSTTAVAQFVTCIDKTASQFAGRILCRNLLKSTCQL